MFQQLGMWTIFQPALQNSSINNGEKEPPVLLKRSINSEALKQIPDVTQSTTQTQPNAQFIRYTTHEEVL